MIKARKGNAEKGRRTFPKQYKIDAIKGMIKYQWLPA